MSIEAITWALRQPVPSSPAKFLLVVLANCANAETQLAWPSVAYLAQTTGQDRKTVTVNLQRLLSWGLIEDTGKRVGATRQIIVYKLICGPDLFFVDAEKRNSSEIGPLTEGTQNRNSSNSPGKDTQFSGKEAQKRYTEPSITNQNPKGIAQRFALRFAEFWQLYPKRVGKEPCLRKWKASKLDNKADEILAKLKVQVETDARWLDGFAPNPLTYLNQARWNDEIQLAKPEDPGPGSSAPRAVAPPRKLESKLENALAFIDHQYRVGAYGDDQAAAAARRDREIADARRKYEPQGEPVDA